MCLNKIKFHLLGVSYNIRNKKKLKSFLLSLIKHEKPDASAGNINVILCSDQYLFDLNKKYLKHHTYTDIITFDYCDQKLVTGDIFISIDRIKDNAIKYNTSCQTELLRVIFHGFLHLCGYKDKGRSHKKQMTEAENFHLNNYHLLG